MIRLSSCEACATCYTYANVQKTSISNSCSCHVEN